MKTLHVACLVACLPALAIAQTGDAPPKPPPFDPIVAADHAGVGRVGVRLVYDKESGLPMVAALTRGGPGAYYGLRVGDLIVKIDKNFTNTLTQDEISLALHGEPGTGVEVTVQRDDNPHLFVFAVERRVIAPGTEDMVNPPISGMGRQ